MISSAMMRLRTPSATRPRGSAITTIPATPVSPAGARRPRAASAGSPLVPGMLKMVRAVTYRPSWAYGIAPIPVASAPALGELPNVVTRPVRDLNATA